MHSLAGQATNRASARLSLFEVLHQVWGEEVDFFAYAAGELEFFLPIASFSKEEREKNKNKKLSSHMG